MEVSTATLQLSSSLPLTAPKTLACGRRSFLSVNPTSTKGFHLLVKPVRLRRLSVVTAVAGDSTSNPNDLLGTLQKVMLKESRIVQYLLTIEDPEELLSALQDAVTPPEEESEEKDVDILFTTPEKLQTYIKAILDVHHLKRDGTILMPSDLMKPKIIRKLEDLDKVVKKKFL